MDELREFVAFSERSGDNLQHPHLLLIVPDFISIGNVEERLTAWGKGASIQKIELTTIEDSALKILKQFGNGSTEFIPNETRRALIVRAVQHLSTETNNLANKIWTLINGAISMENEDVVKSLDAELDEFLRGIVPPSLDGPSEYLASLHKIAASLPEPYHRATAHRALDFYERLMRDIQKQIERHHIPGFFSRAHLVGEAANLLIKDGKRFKELYPHGLEIWVSGIPTFDPTVLLFLLRLNDLGADVRINVGGGSAERLASRIKSERDIEIKFIEAKPRATTHCHLIEVPDIRREVEVVALSAAKLQRSGQSPGSIVVVCRDSSQYQAYIDQIVEEFGLASHFQTRRSLNLTISFRLILSLLNLLSKVEGDEPIAYHEITDPYRLGFPDRTGNILSDKQFLWTETEAGRLSGNHDHLWTDWKKIVAQSDNSHLHEIVTWVDGRTSPDVEPLKDVLVRFNHAASSWRSLLRLTEGYLQDRFEVCDLHMTAKSWRLLSLFDRVVEHAKVAWKLDTVDEPLRWRDIRGGFLAIAGAETYGVPLRDAKAIRFVDAGNSQFVESKVKLLVGLKADGFPRKYPKPFLIPEAFRRAVNREKTLMYLRDAETDYESELELFNAALGSPNDEISTTITMPYLDERGHKESWSVFVDGTGIKQKIQANQVTSADGAAYSPKEYWKMVTRLSRGRRNRSDCCASIADDVFKPFMKQTLGSRLAALESRVITRQPPQLGREKDTQTERLINDIKQGPIPAQEIDLFHHCPMMYYFYRFVYALAPYNASKPGGRRDYIPEWKDDFYLGPTPPPIRRGYISTRMEEVLKSILGDQVTAQELRSQRSAIETRIRRERGLDYSGKDILINTVSYIIDTADPKSPIELKPAGLASRDANLWQPGFLTFTDAEGTLKHIHLARCLPEQIEVNGQWMGVHHVLHRRSEMEVLCPRGDSAYSRLPDDEYRSIIRRLKMLDFTPRDPQELQEKCPSCMYATLCGEWGFH